MWTIVVPAWAQWRPRGPSTGGIGVHSGSQLVQGHMSFRPPLWRLSRFRGRPRPCPLSLRVKRDQVTDSAVRERPSRSFTRRSPSSPFTTPRSRPFPDVTRIAFTRAARIRSTKSRSSPRGRTVAGPSCMNCPTLTSSSSGRSFHRTRPTTIAWSFVTAQTASGPGSSSARTCPARVSGRQVAVAGRRTCPATSRNGPVPSVSRPRSIQAVFPPAKSYARSNPSSSSRHAARGPHISEVVVAVRDDRTRPVEVCYGFSRESPERNVQRAG